MRVFKKMLNTLTTINIWYFLRHKPHSPAPSYINLLKANQQPFFHFFSSFKLLACIPDDIRPTDQTTYFKPYHSSFAFASRLVTDESHGHFLASVLPWTLVLAIALHEERRRLYHKIVLRFWFRDHAKMRVPDARPMRKKARLVRLTRCVVDNRKVPYD